MDTERKHIFAETFKTLMEKVAASLFISSGMGEKSRAL
jgi:hypothetical protein